MPSCTGTEPRIRVEVVLDDADRRSALHDTTFWSLRNRPKELPAVWLYDERGSLLFEEITRLVEYYPTHCEREILLAHAAEIATRTEARTLVELGSGTSEKTTILLDALDAAGTLERFVPVDASEDVLRAAAHALGSRYRTIGIHAIVADFERHLSALPDGESRLIAFLGSTIGNLDPDRRARLLAAVGERLGPGDAFLLGVDLVKDAARVEAAYNDAGGVTEAFVRNGLDALNGQLGANFDQEKFEFVARWDDAREWMDIGFTARSQQVVSIPGLEVEVQFEAGEPLRLEISAKFRRQGLERELAAANMQVDAWWTDSAAEFGLLLASGIPRSPPLGSPIFSDRRSVA